MKSSHLDEAKELSRTDDPAGQSLSAENDEALSKDARWQTVERIAASSAFQKSIRLPSLLRYLARHTILGEQRELSEQRIGQAVFGKRQHFDPAEDSSVRANVRQLRLKLHEYYLMPGTQEDWIISLPKGGYALDFAGPVRPTPALPPTPEMTRVNEGPSRSLTGLAFLCASLAVVAVVCAVGWWRATLGERRPVPWPLDAVINGEVVTNLILADAGTSVRMLGNQELSLDTYISHSYPSSEILRSLNGDEASLAHYLVSTRLTSLADANAAATLSILAGDWSNRILIRSARDVNSTDLTHGNFVFVGSRSSNPWVQVAEQQMNFQILEKSPLGVRYVLNRHPKPGEQATYQPSNPATLASGDDYAVMALLPAKTGTGTWLVLEGVRMEGTNAAIALLRTPEGRSKLFTALAALRGGEPPRYWEVLLHAQSVAGATMAVDVESARAIG